MVRIFEKSVHGGSKIAFYKYWIARTFVGDGTIPSFLPEYSSSTRTFVSKDIGW